MSVVLAAAGCAGTPASGKGPATREFRVGDLAKADVDTMAEIHIEESLASIRLLAEKLYRRNPREWRKGGFASLEQALAQMFSRPADWRFARLQSLRSLDALNLAFEPTFSGDRVFALGVGLASMLYQAYGERTEFYLPHRLDPQALYNAARNIEIVVWRLSNATDASGQLMLLSNEIALEVRNLSFEREFGKLIAYQDMLARVVAQRSHRTIRAVVQNLATAVFLPVTGPLSALPVR